MTSEDSAVRTHRFAPSPKRLVGAAIALFLAVLVVLGSFGPSLTVAFADEDKPEDTFNEASEGTDKSDEGFQDVLDQEDDPNNPNFASIVKRIFGLGYMNAVEDGVAPSGAEEMDYICDPDHVAAGTAVYHNCDIPTLLTEFAQDVLGVFGSQGVVGAETSSATLDSQWFGLPTNLVPNDSVPVDESKREVKYTGLELYGYNFRYTMYNGEWDHIKVITAARTMSNFGLMDNLKLGATAIFDGAVAGLNQGSENFAEELSEGDVLGAVGGFFTGFFEGAASQTVKTILDTSDLNVYNTNSWYRVKYGSTLYGARELSADEQSARALAALQSMLTGQSPDEAKAPEDLTGIQEPPEEPDEAISKCEVVKNSDGEMKVTGNTTISPGISEEDCASRGSAAADEVGYEGDKNHVWSEDGTQKKQTLKEWKEANSDFFDVASKYNVECEAPEDEDNRKDGLAKFYGCWSSAYNTALTKAIQEGQTASNDEWLDNILTGSFLSDFMALNEKANFNAPWNRFVCVSPTTGEDVRDASNQPINAFDSEGNLSEECAQPLRSPVQNGYFGNGYTADQKSSVKMDTRWTAVEHSPFNYVVNFPAVGNYLADGALGVAAFATRVSNTAIMLSFSPIMEAIGIQDTVISLVTSFRDSVFFPLLMIVVGLSAIQVVFSAARQRNYAQQFLSLLFIGLTIVAGAMVLVNPERTIKFADEAPAAIETAIIGTIYDFGNNGGDELCTASGTSSSGVATGLEGETLQYSPKDSVRTLMCENWRAFAFNPWVAGQFGTTFDNLYSAESGKANAMTNTNGDLVGDASVNFGGGKEVKNWATFQLDAQLVGTSMDPDYSETTGSTSPDMYRLVDMQAGPNGGEGTDPSYFEAWSGKDIGTRLMTSVTGAVAAVVAMVTVIVYSIAKIEIAFASTMLLLFIPFMFLIGIYPTFGRRQLKGYFMNLVGLFLQRIFLVLMLGVLFRVVVGFSTASTDYILGAVIGMVTCAIMLAYKGALMGLIQRTMSEVGGSFMGDAAYRPREVAGNYTPGFIRNRAGLASATATGFAGGAIGGFMATGSVRNAFKTGSRNANLEGFKSRNRQVAAGLGGAESLMRDVAAADRKLEDRYENSSEFKDERKQIAEKVNRTSATGDGAQRHGFVSGIRSDSAAASREVGRSETYSGPAFDGRVMDGGSGGILNHKGVETRKFGSKRRERIALRNAAAINAKRDKLLNKLEQNRRAPGYEESAGYGPGHKLDEEDRGALIDAQVEREEHAEAREELKEQFDERVAANKRVRRAAGKVRKTAVKSDRRAEFVGDMKNDLGEMMKRARKLETDRTDREDRRSED